MSAETASAAKPAEAARAVVIRASREADMPAVQRIYAYHVLHGFGSFEEEPPDLAELMRRRADCLARRLPYLAAERAGHVVGYAYAGPWRTRAAYRYTVENSIYVDPAETGHGIGRRLMTELIAQCTALGFRQMVAVIGDSANAPSIKLHEAMGFVLAGNLRSVGRKRGRWLDSVMMQRTLGAGNTTGPQEKG